MKEVCRAIIVNKEGKVLLGKREHGVGANLYALIGGKPDGDESVEETIIREVKEEIGLDFKPTFFLEELDSISVPGETWRVTYFTGPQLGGLELKLDEVIDVIYISESDLDVTPIAFDHKRILRGYFMSKSKIL